MLYTPTLGRSTRVTNGLELVLERVENEPWLPLAAGREFSARVRLVNVAGDTALTPDVMVLSLGRQLALPAVQAGAVLKISTATLPDLAGVKFAIGGGPRVVENGRAVKQKMPENVYGANTYELRSIFERHPRSAIGWDKNISTSSRWTAAKRTSPSG